jgi:type I restriction enzyme S subunit
MSSEGWKMVELSDIIDFDPVESIPKNSIAKKIDMEKLLPFTRKVIGYTESEFKGGSKFRNGDTLFARITPCLENGKTAIVDILSNNEVGFGSTEFIVLRSRKDISDEKYVYYLSISNYVRNKAIKSMAGTSGRQRVQKNVLADIKIPCPPLTEQRAIADTLSCLDDMIQLNNRTNKVLEEMAQAIFKHWFVDFEFPNENGEPYKSSGGEMVDSELGEIPRGWDVGVLSDLADITMGQSPPGSSYNSSGEGMIFFQGRTDFGHRFPSVRLYTTEPKRIASKGETLLSVRAPVGDINKALETCCIGRGLSALESKLGYNSYIYYCLQGSVAILDIFNAEGTVFGSITKKALSNIPIVISPEKQMKKFEFTVNEIDRIIENNFEENLIISSVRDTLLPKLMSGEIRVPIEEVG